jgi:hypothetical protein
MEYDAGRSGNVETKKDGDGVGDGLAFPIIVGCEEDFRTLRNILDLLNGLRLVLYEDV